MVDCSGLENPTGLSAETAETAHFCEYCDAQIVPFASCSACCDGEKVGTGDLLYFIRSGASGPIKIGRTCSLRSRLSMLQTGNPELLALVAQVPLRGWQEAFWHAAFAPSLIRAEWFAPSPALLAAIRALEAGGDWLAHVPFDPGRGVPADTWDFRLRDAFDNYSDRAICLEDEGQRSVRAAFNDEFYPAAIAALVDDEGALV